METEKTKLGPCSECEAVDVIIKKARKSYCRTCWKYRCEFTFRKRLFEFGRPAKGTVGDVFKPAERVLICYDGSPSSVALINLALNAMVFGNEEVGKTGKLPFPFKFAILVILESELNGSPGVVGRQKQHLESLLRWTKYATESSNGTSWPLLTASIETSLNRSQKDGEKLGLLQLVENEAVLVEPDFKTVSCSLETSRIDPLNLPYDDRLDAELSDLRKSLKTKTEDKDFLGILKRNLVYTVAESLNISKVFLPEDQTNLAVKMFTMMSLGRGRQVADEMSITSKGDGGMLLSRPLVDFSDDDLRIYLQTLEDVCTEGIVSKGSGKRKLKIDSVERQCDDFISNLQRGYPSTVSTLTRIGCKLQSNSDSTELGNDGESVSPKCSFCKRLSDAEPPTWCQSAVICYGCQNFVNDKSEKHMHMKSILCGHPQNSCPTA